MKTTHIKVKYTLTEEHYRSEVRAADGPVDRERFVAIPVGALSADAREALLDLPEPASPWRSLSQRETPEVTLPEPRVCEPDAEEVSRWLVGSVAVECVKRGLIHLDKTTDQHRAAAARAERIADLTRKLELWESDHAAARTAGLPNRVPRELRHMPVELQRRFNALEAALRAEDEQEEERRRAREREWVAPLAEAYARPELARAAREGRELGDAPSELLRDVLRRRVLGLSWDAEPWDGTPPPVVVEIGEHEPRSGVPTQRAYALHDWLTEGRSLLDGDLPAPVSLSEISRIDVAPRGDDYVWRTGVVVSCLIAKVAVLAEPLDDEEDDDE